MVRRLAFAAAFGLVVSCSDGTGPGPTSIQFTAGNGQTDTVYAQLTQALNVSIPNAPPRTVVRFEALPFDSTHGPTPGAYVGALTSQYYGTFLADSLDDSGEAHALIKLGTIAGTARIKVSAPALDLQAVATFTVLPGLAFTVVALPRDTALFVSGSFQARGTVTDRFGNPRTDPVSYSKVSGGVTVSPSGQITASAIDRASYVVRAGAAIDTGYVSVVPSGTLAALRLPVGGSTPELVMFQLDGSSLQVLTTLSVPTYDDPNPRWSPDGSRVIYSAGANGVSRLFTVTTSGTVSRLISSPPVNLGAETWPYYTHDGAYVYFAGASPGSNFMVWRAASDGTGAVRISPDSVAGALETRPAPAPDDGRIAYVWEAYGPPAEIRIKYPVGDSTSTWFVYGNTPRWDPLSNRLAYVAQYGGPISVVNGDGTGAKTVSQGGRGYEERALDWSPDGQWLVARGSSGLELINVTSGLTLPLGYSGNMNMPTWRP